jgi:hypothetical protein
MFIIPRTPVSPTRPVTHTMDKPQLSLTESVSGNTTPTLSPMFRKDVYDTFIDIYFSSSTKQQYILQKTIIDYVGHPAYAHLLRTMDKDNAYHVMGYLRSQRSVEMYFILDQIVRNPIYINLDKTILNFS